MEKVKSLVAFIIIIVALVGFWYLYLTFSATTTLGLPACLPETGYICQVPYMTTNGAFGFTLGQVTGTTQYNIEIACAAKSNSKGLPYVASTTTKVFNYLTANGSVVAGESSTPGSTNTSALSLLSGQTVTVTGLSCYGTTGQLLSEQPIGTQYNGSLWYNYTNSSASPSTENPWHTVKIATINVKVL